MYFEDKDVYLMSGEINKQCFIAFSKILASVTEKKPKAVLFLSTYGGEPGAGYRITRLLQRSSIRDPVHVQKYRDADGNRRKRAGDGRPI